MQDVNAFYAWFRRERDRILDGLARLVAVETVSPGETSLLPILEPMLQTVGLTVEQEPIHPETHSHPAYAPHPLSDTGSGRVNIRSCQEHQPGRRKTLFNCHLDVVPASHDFPDAFCPTLRNGAIYGRGACDSKGNLVMLLEAMRYVREAGLTPTRNVLLDLVLEEEIGGNGTLSTILHGVAADEVVVLEPTDLRVYRGHRGCITFTIDVHGKPVHMGADLFGISAIDVAYHVIEDLRQMEKELLAEAVADADFCIWQRPVQVNVGRIQGGEWPGAIPARCMLEGNVGFLPRYTVQNAMTLLEERPALKNPPDGCVREIHYPGLRTEGYICAPDLPIVRDLCVALNRAGPSQKETFAWNVSCDARLYSTLLGLPTVIFGAGKLQHAHSNEERLSIDDLATGILTLVYLLTLPSIYEKK